MMMKATKRNRHSEINESEREREREIGEEGDKYLNLSNHGPSLSVGLISEHEDSKYASFNDQSKTPP